MHSIFSRLRRRLLIAAAGSPAVGLSTMYGKSNAAEPLTEPDQVSFFSEAERLFIEAACARLIPEGDDNTGALTAAVPFFIERQLAGPYGQDRTRYTQPPWNEGTPEQGYQLSHSPAQVYRLGIAEVNAYCTDKFQASFADLSTEQQDAILHQLDDGDIELEQIPSKVFFDHLWQNTLEGFLSDPMYGGNRNFTGWKLIGFPGPRYNYVDEITRHGQPYILPPVGLLGRDGQRIKG